MASRVAAVMAFATIAPAAAEQKLVKLTAFSDGTCTTKAADMDVLSDTCVTRGDGFKKYVCDGSGVKEMFYSDSACTTANTPASFDMTATGCTSNNQAYFKASCVAMPSNTPTDELMLITHYSANDCGSATAKKEEYSLQGTCTDMAAHGGSGSQKHICENSKVVTVSYSDSACTTITGRGYHMGTCQQSDSEWMKATCVAKPAAHFQYAMSAGSATCEADKVLYGTTIRPAGMCILDGDASSTKLTAGGGSVKVEEFASSDCSGSATESKMMACAERCEVVEGGNSVKYAGFGCGTAAPAASGSDRSALALGAAVVAASALLAK